MKNPIERPTEVEAKFTLAGPTLLHELLKRKISIEGYHFGEACTREARDNYLDTPDFRLLRSGYQLRVCVEEGVWQAALKSRGVGSGVGIYRRLEIEAPLDDARLPSNVRFAANVAARTTASARVRSV